MYVWRSEILCFLWQWTPVARLIDGIRKWTCSSNSNQQIVVKLRCSCFVAVKSSDIVQQQTVELNWNIAVGVVRANESSHITVNYWKQQIRPPAELHHGPLPGLQEASFILPYSVCLKFIKAQLINVRYIFYLVHWTVHSQHKLYTIAILHTLQLTQN